MVRYVLGIFEILQFTVLNSSASIAQLGIDNVHLDLRPEKYGCNSFFFFFSGKGELFYVFYDLFQSQWKDDMLKKRLLCASDLVFSEIQLQPSCIDVLKYSP